MSDVDQVRLRWRDANGEVERVLDVGKLCPRCSTRSRHRADTVELCTDPSYVPVECKRCYPGTYYALPREYSSSRATRYPPDLGKHFATIARIDADQGVIELSEPDDAVYFEQGWTFAAIDDPRSLRERVRDAWRGLMLGWRGAL